MYIVVFEKIPVAAAAIHRFRRQLAFKFRIGLRHDSWEPDDALDLGVFGWKRFRGNDLVGWFALLHSQKVVAPRCADQQEGLEIRLSARDEVFRIIVYVHRVEPDRGQLGLSHFVQLALGLADARCFQGSDAHAFQLTVQPHYLQFYVALIKATAEQVKALEVEVPCGIEVEVYPDEAELQPMDEIHATYNFDFVLGPANALGQRL